MNNNGCGDEPIMYLGAGFAGIQRIVTIYLTPDELRSAADFMESGLAKSQCLGDEVPKIVVFDKNYHLRVEITYRQELDE